MYCQKIIMFLVVLFISVQSAIAYNDPVLTWDINSDAEYYEVYIQTGEGAYTKVYTAPTQNSNSVNLNALLINNEPLVQGTNYRFFVKAFNDCGNSSDFSDPVVYTIAVPGIVGNPSVNKSIISWPALADAIKYRLTLKPTVLTEPTIEVETTNISVDTNTVNMSQNVPYIATVAAVNDTGVWGAESNAVTYTRRSVRPCSNVRITKIPRTN